MKQIFKVVSQTETIAVQSQKAENGLTSKCHIVLQEINGRYADAMMATMLGKDASLRFTVREYNGQVYQDIVVNDIIKINH